MSPPTLLMPDKADPNSAALPNDELLIEVDGKNVIATLLSTGLGAQNELDSSLCECVEYLNKLLIKSPPDLDLVSLIGRSSYRALFRKEIDTLFDSLLRKSGSLRIYFKIDTKSPVFQWPIELLRRGDRRLSLDSKLTISRISFEDRDEFLSNRETRDKIPERHRSPLRVLVILGTLPEGCTGIGNAVQKLVRGDDSQSETDSGSRGIQNPRQRTPPALSGRQPLMFQCIGVPSLKLGSYHLPQPATVDNIVRQFNSQPFDVVHFISCGENGKLQLLETKDKPSFFSAEELHDKLFASKRPIIFLQDPRRRGV